ncbi:hypothetical protein MTR_8g463630 [Medicago truncatula]|uniref:Uncharacterized protein n=1 Tax=Medicago truncatula TaxID=3880 RepID=A0A072TRR4_MEDTR|nr:hypothetical protein MTR_8g463630 [Medicago truncatula]
MWHQPLCNLARRVHYSLWRAQGNGYSLGRVLAKASDLAREASDGLAYSPGESAYSPCFEEKGRTREKENKRELLIDFVKPKQNHRTTSTTTPLPASRDHSSPSPSITAAPPSIFCIDSLV